MTKTEERVHVGSDGLDDILMEISDLVGEREARGADVAPRLAEILAGLHDADIADLLESLPSETRLLTWRALGAERYGSVLIEARDAVAVNLLQATSDANIASGLQDTGSIDDVAAVLRKMSPSRRRRLIQLSGYGGDANLQRSLSYANDTVGEVMDFNHVVVAQNQPVCETIETLRRTGLPSHCDKLFVVDEWKILLGVLPIKFMLLNSPSLTASDLMVKDSLHTLEPDASLDEAADMFERYDLISAPVLDGGGRVLGRITIDEILFHLHTEKHAGLFNSAGMPEDEDLFAPVRQRIANRGMWILINLLAAFMVSRVVGSFEATIVEIVALASLMPIIASMAGNAGMQTATLVIRALALNQLGLSNWRALIGKELGLGALNGAMWGLLVGAFGYAIYLDLPLAVVLTVSMTAVFMLASLAGFLLPLAVMAVRGDPALGASVLVTVVTDFLSFFIFLGLASVTLR